MENIDLNPFSATLQRHTMGLFDGTPLESLVVCSRCAQSTKLCTCLLLDDRITASEQRLKVTLEKRRRGKIVTVVSGFQGGQVELQQLLTELKNSCGAGGTIAEQTLEIQGDQQTRVLAALGEKGYRLSGQKKRP